MNLEVLCDTASLGGTAQMTLRPGKESSQAKFFSCFSSLYFFIFLVCVWVHMCGCMHACMCVCVVAPEVS